MGVIFLGFPSLRKVLALLENKKKKKMYDTTALDNLAPSPFLPSEIINC